MKAYGFIVASLALFIGLATHTSLAHSMQGIAILFILGAVATIPAIITYTTLGLNGEDGDALKKSIHRRAIITEKHPNIWKPLFGIAGFYIAYAVILRDARVFAVFSSLFCAISAYWALGIFSKAKALLDPVDSTTPAHLDSDI